MRSRTVFAAGVAMALLIGVAGVAVADAPDDAALDSAPAITAAPDVSIANIKTHLNKFQTIATANGGNRAAGTSGYDRSADYVVQKLRAAGFQVTRQTCTSCQHRDDNIIANWPGGDASNTIMLGAHLDSVRAGAGSNDNASGSAALLEVALTLAAKKPTLSKHVRFAWWAEEELGMHGSQHYVNRTGVAGIEAYFNLDMVGGTNAGYFVDNKGGQQSVPFMEYFDEVGFPAEEMTDCCSDNLPFSQAGVATSLLSTGYGEKKTSAQAAKWGGTAGVAFDPCYHRACDKYPGNISTAALNRMADATAYALWDSASRPASPYVSTTLCGSGFSVQERAHVKTSGGAILGDVYLLWNNTTKRNCAVTLKTSAMGTATETSVELSTDDGRSADDSGAFGYYAGPVSLAASGVCVAASGKIRTASGTLGTGTIPMGHCG